MIPSAFRPALDATIPFLVVLVLLLVPIRAPGQVADSLRLRPGDQIRLSDALAMDDVWVSGRVLEVWAHGFAFAPEGQPAQRVSREFLTIDTIDVAYRDAGESARAGGVLGGFVGASLGILAGALLASRMSIDTGTSIALVGAAGGLVGLLSGALAGASLSPLRWHRYVFQNDSGVDDVPRQTNLCLPTDPTCAPVGVPGP